jgi:hypothetical protein
MLCIAQGPPRSFSLCAIRAREAEPSGAANPGRALDAVDGSSMSAMCRSNFVQLSVGERVRDQTSLLCAYTLVPHQKVDRIRLRSL